MALYLVETDKAGSTLNPIQGWYGPIDEQIPCEWIYERTECESQGGVGTETWFPSARHLRRPDWLLIGVWPPRPAPRGLRWELLPGAQPGGVPPSGVLGIQLESFVADPIGSQRGSATYSGKPSALPRGDFEFETSAISSFGVAMPANFTDDQYTLDFRGDIIDADGKRWYFTVGPDGFNGGSPLPRAPIKALLVSSTRQSSARAVGSVGGFNKVRSIRLLDPVRQPQCVNHRQLPASGDWFRDFFGNWDLFIGSVETDQDLRIQISWTLEQWLLPGLTNAPVSVDFRTFQGRFIRLWQLPIGQPNGPWQWTISGDVPFVLTGAQVLPGAVVTLRGSPFAGQERCFWSLDLDGEIIGETISEWTYPTCGNRVDGEQTQLITEPDPRASRVTVSYW